MSQENSTKNVKIVGFLNQKGGVGKTTLAYNTAHACAKRGARVLLVDMDPQANLTQMMGVLRAPDAHIFQLLINSVKELKPLHNKLTYQDCLIKSDGVFLLPSDQMLSAFELTFAAIKAPRQLILRRLLQHSGILGEFDVVIIDGPPTLGLLMVNILCAIEGVLVPFMPDAFSEAAIVNFQSVLGDVADMEIVEAPQVLAYIPNMVDERRRATTDAMGRFLSSLPADLMVSPLKNKALLAKSQAEQKSIYEYKSKDFIELQEYFSSLSKRIWDTKAQENLQ
jgi:chromosome partitioning protein